jgi:hypothetical protein
MTNELEQNGQNEMKYLLKVELRLLNADLPFL